MTRLISSLRAVATFQDTTRRECSAPSCVKSGSPKSCGLFSAMPTVSAAGAAEGSASSATTAISGYGRRERMRRVGSFSSGAGGRTSNTPDGAELRQRSAGAGRRPAGPACQDARHGSGGGRGQGGGRGRLAARARRPRGGGRAPAAPGRLVAAEGQARPRRDLGGGRAARGARGDRVRLPARPRAAADLLHGPEGTGEGGPLLAHGARGGRVHAEPRGRRAALADPLSRGGASDLSARPGARRRARVNRERFPGLADGWVRLDGPGGTQIVDAAIDAMTDWMRSGRTANEGGAFPHARDSAQVVEDARAAVARMLGADARGVAFGPSMTALTMAFSAAVGRTLRPGDEIVCTRLDHDANVRPWLIAAERAGARVRFAEPEPDTLELPASAVEAVLSNRTRWIAVTAASNAVGTVPELPAIVAAARRIGARVYVDAVHASPHRPHSVAELDVDALACSAYKWFGPHIGILCARPELLEELTPDKLRPSSDGVPERWELGTLPFEALAGVRAAADYVVETDWAAVREHEEALLATALDGLG